MLAGGSTLKRTLFRVSIQLFITAVLTSGCSAIHPEKKEAAVAGIDTTTPETTKHQNTASQYVEPSPVVTKPTQGRQQIIEIGSGNYISEDASTKKPKISAEEGEIILNFQGTDIHEFVKAILGDILGKNYIIDPKVAGKVSINTSKPVNQDELFPLLEEILAINGIAIIEDKNYYKILAKTNAARGNLAPTTTATDGGYSIRIVPLTYIAAQEMQKILEPFITEGGSVRVDSQRNLLILGGTPQELAQLQETIDIFDVDWLRGMSVGLYPLDYVDPKTLKTELDGILSGVGGSGSGELLGGLVRTISLERLNSILLISSTPSALREAEIWLYRLDRPGEQTGQRLYVYKVQNAKATELAGILSQIFNTSTSGSTAPPPPALAPGTTPVQISSSENGEQEQSKPATTKPTSVGDSGLTLSTSGDIEIIADDVRNALVILATPSDYKMVENAIRELDIVPLQVLIEASIIEVSLTNDLNYGVEWFFKNNNINNNKEGQGLLDLGDPGLAALAPGFSYTIIDSAANVRLVINALAEESDVNVLSSPSLMVLNNNTAFINVGDSIPIATRSSISNIDSNAPTVNEIQYQETGVTLTVTPRVNDSGLVTMEIRQEVSDAVRTTTSTLDSPTLRKREIESVVAINSGETIVLGGLIRDSQTYGESGVPFLYKIPVIGKLFGTTNDETSRTELLVLITPRVVRNRNEARGITEEFRRKLKGIPPLENQIIEEQEDKAS